MNTLTKCLKCETTVNGIGLYHDDCDDAGEIVALDAVVYPEAQFIDLDAIIRVLGIVPQTTLARVMCALNVIDDHEQLTDGECRMGALLLDRLSMAYPETAKVAASL